MGNKGWILLVSHKDLEAVHDLGEGDGAVVFPVLDGLDVVDEDDEIFVFALVVDFGLVGVSAGHGCVFIWFDWEVLGCCLWWRMLVLSLGAGVGLYIGVCLHFTVTSGMLVTLTA